MQFDRSSPFSLWDWGEYRADGLPDLKWLQQLLQVAVLAGALMLALVPRRKSPLQLAAFSAALIAAFELLLTHWSGLYIVWFFPFALLAMICGAELLPEPVAEQKVADAPATAPTDPEPALLPPAASAPR